MENYQFMFIVLRWVQAAVHVTCVYNDIGRYHKIYVYSIYIFVYACVYCTRIYIYIQIRDLDKCVMPRLNDKQPSVTFIHPLDQTNNREGKFIYFGTTVYIYTFTVKTIDNIVGVFTRDRRFYSSKLKITTVSSP